MVRSGVSIIDRTRRRVALTPAGAALLERAERLLEDSEAARRAVAAAQGHSAGALDVAASLTIAAYVLPGALALLAREHPEVRVIAVAPEKNFVVYYWASLNIHSNDIEASEQGILSVMRTRMVANGAI